MTSEPPSTVLRTRRGAGADDGASAIEYVLLAAMSAIVLIVGITMFGGFLNDTFEDTCDAVTAAGGTALDTSCGTGSP